MALDTMGAWAYVSAGEMSGSSPQPGGVPRSGVGLRPISCQQRTAPWCCREASWTGVRVRRGRFFVLAVRDEGSSPLPAASLRSPVAKGGKLSGVGQLLFGVSADRKNSDAMR